MPDQEMIDRVTKSIAKTMDNGGTEKDCAIAAIKAMREPTQEMMNAAIRKGIDCGFCWGYPEYEDVYKATISSILND